MKKLLIAGAILVAASASLSASVIAPVSGSSNIFQAGLGAGGTPISLNMGIYPLAALSFTAGSGQTISFDSITGTTSYGAGSPSIGPDGIANTFGGTATSITSNTGISGISFSGP